MLVEGPSRSKFVTSGGFACGDPLAGFRALFDISCAPPDKSGVRFAYARALKTLSY
jgi:hypothetical protein